MKQVMILGGGGYIGSVLTELLLDAGHHVRVLDRFFFGQHRLRSLEERPGLTLIKEDIRNTAPKHMEGVDVVMDLAGISNDPSCDLDVDITKAINVEGCRTASTAAKSAGVERYIYSSSCSVYGSGGNNMLDESSPLAPVSEYARSKIEAEKNLRELQSPDFTVTFLRNATVYGLSHRMRFDLVINIMSLFAFKTRKIHVLGGGKQWRPLIHVRDVARAFTHIMECDRDAVAGEVFNVGATEQNYQVLRIAQMVAEVFPYTTVEMVPDDPDKRSYRVDFSKIEQQLGFRVERTPHQGIVEIKEALERSLVEDDVSTKTVQYYRYLLDAAKILDEVMINGKVF